MTDQPQQPEVVDPDNVPETLCEGSFNISFTGPLAVITFTHLRPEAGPLFTGTVNPSLDGPQTPASMGHSIGPSGPEIVKSGWRARGAAKNNRCPNCVLQSLRMTRKGDWDVQLQVWISVVGHNRIHSLGNIG
jgi:hypothetical protein